MYMVEIGGLEVTATLKKRGSKAQRTEPEFNMDAGLDWEGFHHLLSSEDETSVATWICDNYPDEVYVDD